MADRTIDILLNMQTDGTALNKTTAGVKKVEKSLKDVEAQANRTREKMEKLAQVGNRLALVGGAITAPFILAMKKYVDTAKDSEGTSKRIIELQKKWEDSQVRIGRVTAEIVLPALEKALDVVNKVADFAERNPGAIKAALAIGGSLVVIGGFLSTAASIVSTLATIQGLAAGLGIGGAVAGAGGAAGLGAALAPLLAALAPIAIIAGQVALIVGAVVLAAEATRQLLNWALGTNQTWSDIATTAKQLFILSGMGWKMLFERVGEFIKLIPDAFRDTINKGLTALKGFISSAVSSLGRIIGTYISSLVNGIRATISGISNALQNMANAISNFFKIPKKANGGMTNGVSIAGEAGREFVMSNRTTRAAENMLGGQLTQQRLLQALASGRSNRVNINQRFDAAPSVEARRAMINETLSALAGAL